MTISLELEVNKRMTRAFIAVRPVTITLTPRTDVADGAGGAVKTNGTARAPQTFSLIEPGGSGYKEPAMTDAGAQYTIDFMLLGEFDAVIAVDDVFTHDGREFKVLSVMPFNGYERRALVVRHGW